MLGASAVFLTIIECLQKHCRMRQVAGAVLAFFCFMVLAWMPCFPASHQHVEVQPTMEARPDLNPREKLLLAHLRRIKTEREIANAWTK